MSTPRVELHGLFFRSLRDFSCAAFPGERIGLFGQNGSGKSSLLQLISGIERTEIGVLRVRTRRISYVCQDVACSFAPWYSVEYNLKLAMRFSGLRYAPENTARIAAELGLDFPLQKHPGELSGGQRQLAALLRALITEPELLLLDEPFSALDRERRERVRGVLQRLQPGTLLFISAHRDDETFEIINRSIFLESSYEVPQPDRVFTSLLSLAGSR